MTKITKSDLFTGSWRETYSVLNNRSYVADPADSTGQRKFIYARVPNIKGQTFSGFPYIILNQPLIVQDRSSVNAQRKNVAYSMDIEVHTRDSSSNDSSNGIPNGNAQIQLNSISDDIFETFNNMTVKQLLRNNGIDNVKITSNNFDVDFDEHNNIVLVRTFQLQFSGKKDVY